MTTIGELKDKIDAFLIDYRETEAGEWAPVLKQDKEALHEIINTLLELKWQLDIDLELPIRYELIDRTRCYKSPYSPIPFGDTVLKHYPKLSQAGVAFKQLNEALFNLDLANDEVRRYRNELNRLLERDPRNMQGEQS